MRLSRFSRADLLFVAVMAIALPAIAFVRQSHWRVLVFLLASASYLLSTKLLRAFLNLRFDVAQFDAALDGWDLESAEGELAICARAWNPRVRELAVFFSPYVHALRGNAEAFHAALATAVGRGFAESSWVILGRAVMAARYRNWALVRELLEYVSLPGLDEPRLALAEALLSWANGPTLPPSVPLKPAVLVAKAELEAVRAVWPELTRYLARRPPAELLN